MGQRTGILASCSLAWIVQCFLLEFSLWAIVDTSILTDSGGFSISRFPALNLFALQCNGSYLPSDVRSIQYMGLKRAGILPDGGDEFVASLSISDGVRLQNGEGNANVYVNGVLDMDNIPATSLTVLLNDAGNRNDMTYICTISYTTRGGNLVKTDRMLNVSYDVFAQADVKVPDVQLARPTVGQTQQAAAPRTWHDKTVWSTPMILLITMAGLLFVLFIVCVLLIVDRFREYTRNRLRMERNARMKPVSREKGDPSHADNENRPLPSPPTNWTYPQSQVGQRSPYNRLRIGVNNRNMADDTGYDTDASMHYCTPFDDLGEPSHGKAVMETFGKQLSPLYATSPTMATS